MKKLDISHISTGVSMPFKSGSIQFIQDAAREALAGLFTSLVPVPLANKVYVISGVRNTSNITNSYDITAGYVFVNGEIFEVAAQNFVAVGVQVYANIITTQFAGNGVNADPVNFSDGSQDNVHDIRKINFIATNTAPGTIPTDPKFSDFIYIDDPKSLIGDTKEIVCDISYITANFDVSGKAFASSERRGWAIMNGNNGTPNDAGRVVLAYGGSYTTLGAIGGAETHVLTNNEMPIHTHDLPADGAGVQEKQSLSNTSNTDEGFNGGNPSASAGGGQPHNNMQPYVVRLRIMKISYGA